MITHGENIIDASGLFNNKRKNQIALNRLNGILAQWEAFQSKLQECQSLLSKSKKENDYTLVLIERIKNGDEAAIDEAEQFIKFKIKN